MHPPADLAVRVAAPADIAALARLRAEWSGGGTDDPDLERRVATWIAAEGERRTIWLATVGGAPAGMGSVFEYRRMPRPGRPDARWGYVSNMFVREQLRNRGVGATLLGAIIAAATERGYVRLVVSPSERSLALYERAGFVVPDGEATGERLLVRPGR